MKSLSGLVVKAVIGGVVAGLLSLAAQGPAWAVPIVFNLGYGGTVAYSGGGAAFTTTNGAVTSVGNGTSSLSIAGGDMDFATGNYIGGTSTSSGFQNIYDSGGALSIYGNAGDGFRLLMSGFFAGTSTFNCCSGSFPIYTSSFSGLLQVTSVDSALASALGFNLPATGASLAQVQIKFGAAPTSYGQAFSGTQGGGALAVTDSSAHSVPEPSAVLLLGVGMLGLVLWRKFQVERHINA